MFAKRGVESFLVQRKVCKQTFGANSSNLAQGDLKDVCQREAYGYDGL
jgi:hypothetical protein